VNNKRIFIGIKIPESLAAQMAIWQKSYSKLPVRWITPQNLHVTLVPPWYQDESELPTLFKRVKMGARDFPSLKVVFDSVEYGPNPKSPRLILTLAALLTD